MRLKISAVTSEKVRVLGIAVAPILGPVAASATRVTALQIIEKTADLPHPGVADPAGEQLCSARRENESAGKQE
jgi:hypothetical protein